MPSRKEKVVSQASDIVYKDDAPQRASKLPVPLQFPLVVILSLSLSALLHSLSFGRASFSPVSWSLDGWWQVGAWRTFELGLGWYGNYDSYDLASLSILAHGPPLYLLRSFYDVKTDTVIISLCNDVLATYIPFRLLRPLSAAHASSSAASTSIPNRDVVTDLPIQILTAILAAGIYTVTLYTAYASYLPVALVTYFANIPSIRVAIDATPISLFPGSLILGLASRSFIFTPAAACAPAAAGERAMAFDPKAATLLETLQRNFWAFSPRTKIVITRTATLMLLSGGNTFLQILMTVEGVEPMGAAAYASIWVTAAFLTGLSLGVVGAV